VEAHQEIVRRFPLSAIRIPQSGIKSSVYFRSRFCFVPSLLRLLLSALSSINSSGGTV